VYVIAYFIFLFCFIVVTLYSVRVCGFVSLVFCNFFIAKCHINCCSVYSSFAAMDRLSNPFLVINVDCICVLFIVINLCILL
jgi:hypothetical protein